MKKAAAIFLPVLLLLFLFWGCSSSGNAAGSTARSPAAPAADAEKATDGANAASTAANTGTAASAARKIEKSAKLTMETLRYEKCTADLESLVSRYGGYLESSSIQGKRTQSSGGARTASYAVRVPAERLDAFLDAASAVGNVTEKSISGRDVTQSYVDTGAKLKTLKTEQTRLLDMMNKASDMESLLKIEQRLTEVQNQIEQLTAELKSMDSLVAFASVAVTVQETAVLTKPAEPTFWGQLGSTLSASFHALGLTFRYLCVFLTAVLPFAAVAGAVLAVVLILRRRMRKKP